MKVGFDPNYGMPNLLDLACEVGNHNMMRMLIKNGAKCSKGNTILHKTAMNMALIKMAKELNVDFNGQNENGESVLHVIHRSDQILDLEVLKELLKICEINTKDSKGKTPLHFACKFGTLQDVKLLLQFGANLNDEDDDGNNVLHFTCEKYTIKLLRELYTNTNNKQNAHKEIIDYLLNNDFDVNKRNKFGVTALHLLCHLGDLDNIEHLIQKGADLTVKDNFGNNLLHFACISSSPNIKVIDFLLNEGFEINVNGEFSRNASLMACKGGCLENLRHLIKKGADIKARDEFDKNALHIACVSARPNSSVIEYLLNEGFDINQQDGDGLTAILLACMKNNLENVTCLVTKGGNLFIKDRHGRNPLHHALRHTKPNIKLTEFLLQKGLDVNECEDILGGTPLHFACKTGSLQNAQLLINYGGRLHTKDKRGNTALHIACYSENLNTELIRFLLSKDFNINARNYNEAPPLHHACEMTCLRNILFLVENGADLYLKDKKGMTALHYACCSKRPEKEVVEFLLSNGLAIDDCTTTRETALHFACGVGQLEIVSYLVSRGADCNLKDSNGSGPLHYACFCSTTKTELIDILLPNILDIDDKDEEGSTPLQNSCQSGNLEIAKYLIKNAAKLFVKDQRGRNPLHMAACTRKVNVEMIEFLLNEGFNVNDTNAENMTALHFASRHGNLANVRCLVKNGANLNAKSEDKSNALHFACLSNISNVDIIDFLIKSGLNVNAKDERNTTPLHLACLKSLENVICLAENGADFNATSGEKYSALHWAIFQSKPNFKIIEFLLKKGCNVNQRCAIGGTALHKACRVGNIDIVSYLIKNGATVDIQDDGSCNALHHACAAHTPNVEVIDLLLKNGLNINEKNAEGQTPLHIACVVGTLENITNLIKRGANMHEETKLGRNVLHVACSTKNNNIEVIDFFLNNGFDINVQTLTGTTALHMACQYGNLENVQHLIEKGGLLHIRDKENTNVLHFASLTKRSNVHVIDFLLSQGFKINEPNEKGYTALHYACNIGNLENVSHLLKCGANLEAVTNEGDNVLHVAVGSLQANIEMIDFLLAHGFDINGRMLGMLGRTIIQTACKGESLQNVLHLLEKGADLDLLDYQENNALHVAGFSTEDNKKNISFLVSRGFKVNEGGQFQRTAIHNACKMGNINNVLHFISCGADLKIKDIHDNNALHIASLSEKPNAEMIEFLLHRGFDVNEGGHFGRTALHNASKLGVLENVLQLLKGDANLNIIDDHYSNPLHTACLRREPNVEMIEFLLNKGLNVNECSQFGRTALHIACKTGVFENVEVLIKNGADFNRQNGHGENALHVACFSSSPEEDIVDLLLRKGVELNIRNRRGNTCLDVVRSESIRAKLIVHGAKSGRYGFSNWRN